MSVVTEPRRLWESDHPYYCSESEYHTPVSELPNEYASWSAFMEDWGDADLDMNLVFRWDWNAEEHTLWIFTMGQRKGIFIPSKIHVGAENEEAVRAWLAPRWERLRELWAPISGYEKKQQERQPTERAKG